MGQHEMEVRSCLWDWKGIIAPEAGSVYSPDSISAFISACVWVWRMESTVLLLITSTWFADWHVDSMLGHAHSDLALLTAPEADAVLYLLLLYPIRPYHTGSFSAARNVGVIFDLELTVLEQIALSYFYHFRTIARLHPFSSTIMKA